VRGGGEGVFFILLWEGVASSPGSKGKRKKSQNEKKKAKQVLSAGHRSQVSTLFSGSKGLVFNGKKGKGRLFFPIADRTNKERKERNLPHLPRGDPPSLKGGMGRVLWGGVEIVFLGQQKPKKKGAVHLPQHTPSSRCVLGREKGKKSFRSSLLCG